MYVRGSSVAPSSPGLASGVSACLSCLSIVYLSICHGDATPRLLLLRPSDSALPEISRRCIFLFHPSPKIASPSRVATQCVLRKRTTGGHYTPTMHSAPRSVCVRKAPPSLPTTSLHPSTSTAFHFFPVLPFVHFLVIAPLTSPTLAVLTP